jgi:hypothetical protein
MGFDEGLVGIAEGVEPDQLCSVSGKAQQLLALRRRQQFSAWHAFEAPPQFV